MTKKPLSKNEVRAALTEYISDHACSDRLPPLRTISRELGVTIYLIRKHLAAMQREGILRTRNRVGMFLTPEEIQMPSIGIISNPELSFPFIDFPYIYAGVISALSERFCLVRCIDFKNPADLPKRISSLGLAGVVWICPFFDNFRTLRDLLIRKHHIPLTFCGENIYLFNRFDLVSNTVSLDWEELTKRRAEFFAAHGKKHILYFAPEGGAALPVFKKHLAGFGIELHESCVLHEPELLESQLSDRIRCHSIDGILVDGKPGFYEALFAFLNRHPEFKPLISVEDHPKVRYLLRRYPKLRVSFQFESLHDFHYRLGTKAADMLSRAISGELVQNPEKYCPNIVDKTFLQWRERAGEVRSRSHDDQN